MEKNDFPTNPVAFAQYVWENIKVGDTLVDRLRNFWKVTSYETYNGRKIRISIRCIDSEACAGGYNNGEYEKLTRYDLARKYYFYINNIAVEIPDVEDWNAGTFVQNYNLLWNIIDTMTPITKEETTDMYALFLLTQEADKIYEEKNEKISTIRTLNELKNKFEKRDYYDGDKIREKCVNCLPKEDKKMTEDEKNYFPKNKEKTGVDTQLKSAFYSQEDLDAAIEKIGDFLETHTNTAKNKCKESVKKIAGFSDEDLDEICTRVVDTFYSASDFSKKTFDEFKSWMKEKYNNCTKEVKEESKEEPKTKTETVKVNNNQSVITVDNNDTDTGTHKVDNIDKLFPNLNKYFNNNINTKDDDKEVDDKEVDDFINRPFHIGDIVIDKNGNVGYISEICSRDNTWFYYYVPVVIKPNHITFKVQKPLDSTLENYIQIGAWDLTYSGARKNLSGFKEFKNLSLTYNKELPEELLKEFLDRNKESLSKKKTDEKDNNTSTTDSINPSLSRKTGNADSLPKYLSKFHLTDSTYSYEVNTKLTTDIVRKLNEVIEALNAITLYHLNEAQEEKCRRQLEERQNELKGTLPSSEKVKNYSSVYDTVRKNADISWPSWKKEFFNNSCAISTHAKKL